MFCVYNILLSVAVAVSLPLWPWLFFSKRRLYRRFPERLGLYGTSLLETLAGQKPIWIHAASVGEVKSAAALIEGIKSRWPDRQILLSTMTATGRKVARQSRLAVDAAVYFPLDLPWVVGRALRRLDPSLILLLETEIWPNFIRAASRRGVPVVVLSGRLSSRSERRFRRFAGVFVCALKEISAFGMQDRENRERLLRLDVDPSRAFVTGSLKKAFVEPAAPRGLEAITGYRSRPVVVAGSTHRGEETLLLNAFARLRAKFPDVLLVIAPRHPERFVEVEGILRGAGLRYRKRSDKGAVDLAGYGIFLLDSVGELFWVYEWATVVFVGGTLVNVGGHNLIEPGRWGKPIVMGPHTANVEAMAKALLEADGAMEIRTGADLFHALSSLLAEGKEATKMGRRARAVASSDEKVLSNTMALVARFSHLPSREKGMPRE